MDANVKAYRDGWRLVEQLEAQENRNASLLERWQQVNSVYALAKSLGILPEEDPEQLQIIRRRWEKLRSRL